VEDQSWEQTYPGKRDRISALRRDVREVLIKGDCPEMVIDAVVHGMSELGANAVVHTPSGWDGGAFVARVFLYMDDNRSPYVWAEVENDGVTKLNLNDLPANHGLDITRSMVTKLGTERGERGRVVYFTVEFNSETGEISQRTSRKPIAVGV
jgi:anti-sigma regulatory factor (Ser/Thr protein kinase)